MYLSEQHKFIFVHNQKTGGQSVARYLAETVADVRAILPRHSITRHGIGKLGPATWAGYYSFGFVRNPWARLVSWYNMITERPQKEFIFWRHVRANASNFEEFIELCVSGIQTADRLGVRERGVLRNQIDYFTAETGEVAVNFIGKFENIQNDFDSVLQKLDLPRAELPKINFTQKIDYRTCYSDTTAALIEQCFEKDIKFFGYTFGD